MNKSIQCSGTTIQGKRCKHRGVSGSKKWKCVDHTINWDASTMEESNGTCFYIIKKGGSLVEEIRRKYYINGCPKYVIDPFFRKGGNYFVSREEFYTVPAGYKFSVVP